MQSFDQTPYSNPLSSELRFGTPLGLETNRLDELLIRYARMGDGPVQFMQFQRIVDVTDLPYLRRLPEDTQRRLLGGSDPHAAEAGTFCFHDPRLQNTPLANEVINVGASAEWRREALVRLLKQFYGEEDPCAAPGEPNAIESLPPGKLKLTLPVDDQPMMSIHLAAGSLLEWQNAQRITRFDFQPANQSNNLPSLFVVDTVTRDGEPKTFIRIYYPGTFRVREISLNDFLGSDCSSRAEAIEEFVDDVLERGLAWAETELAGGLREHVCLTPHEAYYGATQPDSLSDDIPIESPLSLPAVDETYFKPDIPESLEKPIVSTTLHSKAGSLVFRVHIQAAAPDDTTISLDSCDLPVSQWKILRPHSVRRILAAAADERKFEKVLPFELPNLLREPKVQLAVSRALPLEYGPMDQLREAVLERGKELHTRHVSARTGLVPLTKLDLLRERLQTVRDYGYVEAPLGTHPMEWLFMCVSMDLRGSTRISLLNGLGNREDTFLEPNLMGSWDRFIKTLADAMSVFCEGPDKGNIALDSLLIYRDSSVQEGLCLPVTDPGLFQQIGDLTKVILPDPLPGECPHPILPREQLRLSPPDGADIYVPSSMHGAKTEWRRVRIENHHVTEVFLAASCSYFRNRVYGSVIDLSEARNPVAILSDLKADPRAVDKGRPYFVVDDHLKHLMGGRN